MGAIKTDQNGPGGSLLRDGRTNPPPCQAVTDCWEFLWSLNHWEFDNIWKDNMFMVDG